jgi:hypothetical protein
VGSDDDVEVVVEDETAAAAAVLTAAVPAAAAAAEDGAVTAVVAATGLALLLSIVVAAGEAGLGFGSLVSGLALPFTTSDILFSKTSFVELLLVAPGSGGNDVSSNSNACSVAGSEVCAVAAAWLIWPVVSCLLPPLPPPPPLPWPGCWDCRLPRLAPSSSLPLLLRPRKLLPPLLCGCESLVSAAAALSREYVGAGGSIEATAGEDDDDEDDEDNVVEVAEGAPPGVAVAVTVAATGEEEEAAAPPATAATEPAAVAAEPLACADGSPLMPCAAAAAAAAVTEAGRGRWRGARGWRCCRGGTCWS